MPTLIIAEKPSVARGIADAVGAHERRDGYIEGGGYLISWCRGHIIDLDFPQNYPQWSGHWSMSQLPMIPERWRWSVTAPEQYKVLKGLLDRADVELNIVQNGRKLTKSQAKSILSGGTVHLTGLSKKDGSGTFDTDAKLGAAPYTGFVEFYRSEKPGGSAGRTGSRRRGGKR